MSSQRDPQPTNLHVLTWMTDDNVELNDQVKVVEYSHMKQVML